MTIDRRSLLLSLAAGGAALGLPGEVRGLTRARPAEADRPLGLQLYTLRRELAADYEGTLNRVAELGFREVELFSLGTHSAKEVRRMLDDAGLVAPSGHTLLQPIQDDLERLVEDAKTLGHRYLVLAFLLPNQRRSLDDYRRLVDVLKQAATVCAQADLGLTYHNHDFEFVPLEGTVPYDLLLEGTSSEELTLELDLYWTTKAGRDPLEILGTEPSRFPMVHVKDMDDSEARGFTEVGTGVIDFAGILQDPRASGIQHLYVEQDVIRGDAWQSVETSLGGLRRALAL